jgi:hypothetical protein
MPSLRPSIITSQLNFVGVNRSIITRPEKLQEIVIQIGCTLRMPVEKIALSAVYELIADLRTEIPFDRALASIQSQGQIVCLDSSRTGRGLTVVAGTGSTVGVDYIVYDPSDDLVLLTSSEFTTVVSSSSALQSYSASVGASGFSVGAPAGAPSPGSGPNYGLNVGVPVGAVAIIMAGALLIVWRRRKGRVIASTQPLPRPSVVVNPLSMNATGSVRGAFAPMQTRTQV